LNDKLSLAQRTFAPLFELSKEELLTEQNEKKRLHAYARLTTEQIHLYLQVPT